MYITLSFQGWLELYVQYVRTYININQHPHTQAYVDPRQSELHVIYYTVWDYAVFAHGVGGGGGMAKQPAIHWNECWSVTHQEGHVSSRQAVANEPTVNTISG